VRRDVKVDEAIIEVRTYLVTGVFLKPIQYKIEEGRECT
jgi:hypothetical protein